MIHPPSPPSDLSPQLKILYIAEYSEKYFQSKSLELTIRMKTATICFLLVTITTFGFVLSIYYSTLSPINTLHLAVGIPGALLLLAGEITLTTLVGFKLDLPVKAELIKQSQLNQVLGEKYTASVITA